jgi:hypothetical protein
LPKTHQLQLPLYHVYERAFHLFKYLRTIHLKGSHPNQLLAILLLVQICWLGIWGDNQYTRFQSAVTTGEWHMGFCTCDLLPLWLQNCFAIDGLAGLPEMLPLTMLMQLMVWCIKALSATTQIKLIQLL